jgi:RNA polymerase sigma-70 factor (ECF subfamily)
MATETMIERDTTTRIAAIPRFLPGIDGDRELLEGLQNHNPSAPEQLIARYGQRAYRLAVGITGSSLDAEEVVQDAFWTVVRKAGTFRGESAFGSWLYRIVANAAYQKLRGRRGRQGEVSLDEVLPVFDEHGRHAAAMTDWSARVNDPAAQSELRMALKAAIDALPELYRTALLLRDVEGVSNVEIADTLGVSVPIVKSRVHRARLFLRKRLTAVMGGEPACA